MSRAMGLAPDRAETRNGAQGEARRPGDARSAAGAHPSPDPIPPITGDNKAMNAQSRIVADLIDVSAIMREAGIIDIHRDKHLDRFSVTLSDYTMGLGPTVGEALVDAQRRAA